MSKNLRAAALLLAVCVTLSTAAGCGPGGRTPAAGHTVPKAPAATAKPTEGIPPVSPNTVVLYLVTSSSGTDYFPEYGITVESGRQNLIRLLPQTGQAAVVEWNVTADYARSAIRPYTVDGRLFIVRHTGLEYTDDHEFSERDPMTNEPILRFQVSDPIQLGCLAIVGDRYYYRAYSSFDPMVGDKGGELKRLRFRDGTTAEGEVLLAPDDPQNCKGHLDSSDGVLYDAYGEKGRIEIYRRDLATGRIAEVLGAYELNDPDKYQDGYRFAFDDGVAYWALRRLADNRITIWKYDLRGEAEPIFGEIVPNVDEVTYLDVDGGYLAIGDDDGYLLLLDLANWKRYTYEVGFEFYDMQILVTGK